MVHRSFWIGTESYIQVCTSTEDLPGTGQDNDLDALVNIEHGKEFLKVLDHLPCECIVISRPIERHDDDGRHGRGTRWVMRHRDMASRRDFLVRGGELYGIWVKDHAGLENSV